MHREKNPECRNDIVRTLVILTISKVVSKPSRSNCEQVARLLILKYPFKKDDVGDGYVSQVYYKYLYQLFLIDFFPRTKNFVYNL